MLFTWKNSENPAFKENLFQKITMGITRFLFCGIYLFSLSSLLFDNSVASNALFFLFSTMYITFIPIELAEFKKVDNKTYSIICNLCVSNMMITLPATLFKNLRFMIFTLIVSLILWISALILGLTYKTEKEKIIKKKVNKKR